MQQPFLGGLAFGQWAFVRLIMKDTAEARIAAEMESISIGRIFLLIKCGPDLWQESGTIIITFTQMAREVGFWATNLTCLGSGYEHSLSSVLSHPIVITRLNFSLESFARKADDFSLIHEVHPLAHLCALLEIEMSVE